MFRGCFKLIQTKLVLNLVVVLDNLLFCRGYLKHSFDSSLIIFVEMSSLVLNILLTNLFMRAGVNYVTEGIYISVYGRFPQKVYSEELKFIAYIKLFSREWTISNAGCVRLDNTVDISNQPDVNFVNNFSNNCSKS